MVWNVSETPCLCGSQRVMSSTLSLGSLLNSTIKPMSGDVVPTTQFKKKAKYASKGNTNPEFFFSRQHKNNTSKLSQWVVPIKRARITSPSLTFLRNFKALFRLLFSSRFLFFLALSLSRSPTTTTRNRSEMKRLSCAARCERASDDHHHQWDKQETPRNNSLRFAANHYGKNIHSFS